MQQILRCGTVKLSIDHVIDSMLATVTYSIRKCLFLNKSNALLTKLLTNNNYEDFHLTLEQRQESRLSNYRDFKIAKRLV